MNSIGVQKEKVRPMKWMQGVAKNIEKSGHKGIFKAAAERAGKSTREFAEEHKNDQGVLGRRARLALSFMKSKH